MKTLRSQLLVCGFLLVMLPTLLLVILFFRYEALNAAEIKSLFATSALILVASMLLIFRGSRWIISPLRQLTEAAKAIREGDFDYQMEARVLSRGPLETRELCYTFIRMSEKIAMQLRTMEKANEIMTQKEERWQLALRGNKDGIWDWNVITDELFLSDRCHEMLGFAPGEGPTTHKSIYESVHAEDLPVLKLKLSEHLEGASPNYEAEYRRRCKDGSYKWVHDRGQAMWNSDGEAVVRMAGSLTDISERKQMEEKLVFLSMRDSLTGLYNRAYFEEELRRLNDGRYSPIAIIVCDVDGLKLYNDSFGHVLGDRLIQAAARVLSQAFRASDVVARIGGDEFAILLPRVSRETLEMALERLSSSVGQINSDNEEFFLSLSTGMAMSHSKQLNLSRLFREADNNMYREKIKNSPKTRKAIIGSLVKLLESRDYVAEGHTQRIAGLCVRVGTELGLSEERLTDLRLLAEYHDLGKVGIPDKILFKAGPLNTAELTEVKRHCEIGHRIALSVNEIKHIAEYVLKHQEWWNGKGYPLGIGGEEIPLECRILAIADAYEVITHERPYRPALSHEEAVSELKKGAGSQFDPFLVNIFIKTGPGHLVQKVG